MADPKKEDTGRSAAEETARITGEMERLRAKLAEFEAREAASFNLAITSQTEVPAGKNEDGKEFFHYKIDLPPSGGQDIRINGVPYYHGQQYKVDVNTLRDLKDIVHRTWGHEMSIKGSNENFYRRPTERKLQGNRR